MIGRPGSDEYAPWAAGYVSKVAGDDPLAVMIEQVERVPALLRSISEERSLYRYAEGKWSIRESWAHVSDTERIFTYRALRIGRGDQTPLPGFEQDDYVKPAMSDARSWASHVEEWIAVRAATLALFRGFPADAWMRRGTASGKPISMRAVAFITAGHVQHHVDLLRESYGIG
ncbi:MAG: DinB family protein [Bryobacteraceae bacterium]